MPGLDRTGPLGQGPLTGRGLGPCGRGMRRGFARARRFRETYPEEIVLTKEKEKKIFEADLKDLEAEKEARS
jgi:hypothetical protein